MSHGILQPEKNLP